MALKPGLGLLNRLCSTFEHQENDDLNFVEVDAALEDETAFLGIPFPNYGAWKRSPPVWELRRREGMQRSWSSLCLLAR